MQFVRWGVSVGLIALVGCSYPSLPPLGSDEDPDGPVADAPVTPAAPLSCKDLPKTCGRDGNDDCCTSLLVEGGSFFRGYDVAGDSFSGTNDFPATVSSFRLDKYEVTVARFRAFVEAGKGTELGPPPIGGGARPSIPWSGWKAQWDQELPDNTTALLERLKCGQNEHTWTDAPGPNELLPMGCVAWHVGLAFCIWDGGFLPTEAEWNYAASGGNEQRVYPWASPPSSTEIRSHHAVLYSTEHSFYMPVGIKPLGNGRWGHSDLAGNMLEWMFDWSEPTLRNPCVDCAVIDEISVSHVYKGGAWGGNPNSLRSATRNGRVVNYLPDPNNGLRCARNAL